MIRIRNITRQYEAEGRAPVMALNGVTLDLDAEVFASITGPSGCGKSTLLHLLGALDTPSSGELFVNDLPLHDLTEQARTHYRREQVGIIFQFFNLLPTMTVLENVTLPLLLQGKNRAKANESAGSILDLVGLSGRTGHFPHQLSGGEMQRTAIARALVHRPPLLIADEPTGNLDSENADNILDVLRTVQKELSTTLIVVTHSEQVAESATVRVRMQDGNVLSLA